MLYLKNACVYGSIVHAHKTTENPWLAIYKIERTFVFVAQCLWFVDARHRLVLRNKMQTSKTVIDKYWLAIAFLVNVLVDAETSCVVQFYSTEQKNGNFSSPNYPSSYPPATQCLYVFLGQQWEGIRIEFLSFDLQPAYSAG